ncbi:MAG TPA: prolyl oligopeptidase family serine peptidase [Burkholderiaceae bacterium]|nr:prolyl oligopeptidase family serine peptidase [Burkholderiaceae bacterium]
MTVTRTAATAALAFSILAGCTTAPVGPAITPNPNLVVQGIPPIPASVATQVAKYTDFRGHAFVDWHPARREMLVSHRPAGASVVQLFRVAAPLAEPEPLTDGAEPVRNASYEPRDGRYIVFARATGGDEADKLYRLDLPSKQITPLTDTPERHSLEGWLHGSSRLLTLASPLDRTAQGGSRASVSQLLRLIDPLQPAAARTLAELPGGGWGVGGVSWDDRQIALTRYLSANESEVWLLDLASGRRTQLLPAAGGAKATYFAGEFTRDNAALYVVSDQGGEFRELARIGLADQRLVPITADVRWDITGATANDAGTLVAAQANVDGRAELRLYDAKTLRALALPALPGGSVGATHFHPKLADLQFSVNSSQGPSQVWSLDPQSGQTEQWTRAAAPPGIDTRGFGEQQIVRWKSFDGRTISAIVNTPPERITGKRPVLIEIHGGPESQATLGFIGRYNYFVNELGIVLIQPNVRGSAGYGKTFLSLDDGFKREDSVKDIGALLDWIATQANLDASRVAVTGGSYGGYMSLAVATTYSDRIAGSVDVVGISNFLSFLKNTESYRRDLRRVEYGDERDPAMAAHLQKISPLTNAGHIKKPLFVVQGKNDPRVPYTEAEQIVAKVRGNGAPVWYLRAENEGHGFARKENADFQFYATVVFLRQTLKLD